MGCKLVSCPRVALGSVDLDLAKYMAFVPYLPWGMGLVCALLCAVIMLLCARRPVRGAAFVGSGLGARPRQAL